MHIWLLVGILTFRPQRPNSVSIDLIHSAFLGLYNPVAKISIYYTFSGIHVYTLT